LGKGKQKASNEGEYPEFDGSTKSRLSLVYSKIADSINARSLALCHLLLDQFVIRAKRLGICNRPLSGFGSRVARLVPRANLDRPHWRFALGLNNLYRAMIIAHAVLIGEVAAEAAQEFPGARPVLCNEAAESGTMYLAKRHICETSGNNNYACSVSKWFPIDFISIGFDKARDHVSFSVNLWKDRLAIYEGMIAIARPSKCNISITPVGIFQVRDIPWGKQGFIKRDRQQSHRIVDMESRRFSNVLIIYLDNGTVGIVYGFDEGKCGWGQPSTITFNDILSAKIYLIRGSDENENSYANVDNSGLSGPSWPLVAFVLLGLGGIYLISQGVNANLNRVQIGIGFILWLLALSALGYGIVHGELVPKWLSISENASAFFGSYCVSAPPYGRAEDVGIVPVVVAPFELRNVQREIFAADFVKAAHDAALQERPETVDCLSVDNAVNVLASGMADRPMLLEPLISAIFICGDQTDFVRDGFADEGVQGFHIGVFDHARNESSLALDSADDGSFASAASSRRAFIPMPIFVLAADVGFIDFDNADQFAERGIGKSSADAMAEIEGSGIGAEAHHPMDLERANSFFARQHQIDDFEPCLDRNVCILKDRSNENGEAISLLCTSGAFPFEGHRLEGVNTVAVALGAANNAIWPTTRNEVSLAGVVSREKRLELSDCHLRRELGLAHGSLFHV
jgi:hypothetical protein